MRRRVPSVGVSADQRPHGQCVGPDDQASHGETRGSGILGTGHKSPEKITRGAQLGEEEIP